MLENNSGRKHEIEKVEKSRVMKRIVDSSRVELGRKG